MANGIKSLLVIAGCLMSLSSFAIHADQKARQILLLLSFDPLYPFASDVVNTLRNGLSQPLDMSLQVHAEFMDAEFHRSPEYIDAYRRMLSAKMENGERYDLIIAAGDAALTLVAGEQSNLFNDVPVVFMGVHNGDLVRELRTRGGYTGLQETLPVYEQIALLRNVYPGFERLHVITDGLPGYEPQMQQIRQAISSLGQTIVEHSLAKLSWEEMAQSLDTIRNEPVLLVSAREDRLKESRDFPLAVRYLTLEAGAPIWHLWQQGIGSGLIGGVVVDLKASAQRAAAMGAMVLNHISPDDIQVEWHGDYKTLIDAQVVAHYGYKESAFPASVEWLNRDPDFYSRYRTHILLALSFAVFCVAVGLFVWTENRRRRLSDEQLDERTTLLQDILNSIPDLMFYKDVNGRYEFSNRRFNDFFGVKPVGQTDYDLFDKETADFFRQKDSEAIGRRNANVNEEWVQGINGETILLETQKTPIFSKHGDVMGVFGLSRDITELKKAQENLEHLAHHDVLTGLPNRLLLNKKLEYALQICRRACEALAVIFLDLDRFKDINDTIGHDVGDLLLKDVAHRLHNNVRDSDICARLGGDEFVVVLTRIDDVSRVQEKCGQLLEVISRPYSLQGHLLSVFASAGIAVYPEHGNTVDELIRNADAALHKAKELGRNRSYDYHRELTDTMHSRMSLEQDLRSAIEGHHFELHFQPQFHIGEERPRRVEALLRWSHPLRGMISPHEFIPLAETSGMISELGFWVVRSACQQFMFWRQQGLMLDKIAVNVSAVQINASFANTIARIMEHLDFNPAWLELEVTESLMMSGTTEVNQQIHQLRTLGVEFAIDDFGTGYSSLSKIKSMPVTVLKVDQSFVRDINDDVNDYEIIRAIVLMARSLGLTVIAEGVETEAQQQTLKRIGCEWMQGYLYARPMDGGAFYERYVKDEKRQDD